MPFLAVAVVVGAAAATIRLTRAVAWPAWVRVRHCSLVGGAGAAVVALSLFLPWEKVVRTEDGRQRTGTLVEAWPLALAVAVPLAVAVAWLLRPDGTWVRRGLVAAATGVGFTVLGELWIAMIDASTSDEERHHAQIGVHLAFAGYLLLASATAAAESAVRSPSGPGRPRRRGPAARSC